MIFSGKIFQDKKESASLLSVYMHDAKNTSGEHTIFARFQNWQEHRKVGMSSVNTLYDPSLPCHV
jgi:hypothetical protein